MKNFSLPTARVIYGLSQNAARKFQSTELLPEHILLTIIEEETEAGFQLIQKEFSRLEEIHFNLEQYLSSFESDKENTSDLLPMSERTKNLIKNADAIACQLNDKEIDSAHIVLAAVKEETSVFAVFSSSFGLDYEKLLLDLSEIRKEENKKPRKHIEELHEIFGSKINTENIHFLQQEKLRLEKEAEEMEKKAQESEQKTFLSEYTRDITKLFREGKADPIVGREKEIQRLIQILSRRTKNNPVLVGEPGIGKTAIVEGLAQAIAKGNVPAGLLKKKILSLDLTALVAGTKYRGEFEERMKKMMTQVREDRSIILFIDELHTVIGAGGPEGTMDASNMLKPALSRAEIQIIGATTTKEYSRYIEKDSALERRFQMVKVEEPEDSETIQILEGIKKQYEDFHGVIYEEDVIPSIVKLTRRYIPEKFLPDKAIDILDEAGARKKIQENNEPVELKDLENQINALVSEKKELVKNQDYENAAYVRDKVIQLQRQFEVYSNYWKEKNYSVRERVNASDVSKIIAEITGIPTEQLDKNEKSRLLDMEKEMHKMVIGQDKAVSIIAGAVRRNRAGISSPKHPIGSFIFLGPTGVGKTQLAKALAKFIFGKEELLIRIDMSDFMEKHNASRLVGAPPGYVGYENGGLLTEQVRRHPYSVILLDEIEKAHPDVFNLLLQLLEEGELSDNLGHTVNFRNTVIIMTSNAGARKITSESRLGFSPYDEGLLPYDEIKTNAESELKKLLSPELINRIDDIIVFNPLTHDEISKILDIKLKELKERLNELSISIKLSDEAREYLIEKGYEPSMGARPMQRLIQREIEDPLSMELLDENNRDKHDVFVDFKDGNLSVGFENPSEEKNAQENEPVKFIHTESSENTSVITRVKLLD
ncbi:MAG: ATP-dependent Clp protease ATP-binding subunit [Treponema sp.]|nr:ATP-dependent Clp protease ATP-binding subunit [Treponema sp.]